MQTAQIVKKKAKDMGARGGIPAMQTTAHDWERERLFEALDSHKRGLSDAPYVSKWADKATAVRAENEMAFVVSTDEVDRHGDTIAVEGWHFDSYMRNPVFLWAHNYARPAIGRALEVWKEPHELLARVEFAPTDFAQEVASLYQGGYQKGVSVGFRPLKYALRRDPQTGAFLGIDFLEQELLEVSAAPVPANQNALRKALTTAPIMQAYFAQSGSPWDTSFQDLLAALRSVRR